MECKKIAKLMVLSIYDELTASEISVLDNHLHNCSFCSAEFTRLKQQHLKLKNMAGEVPEFDWEKSWRAIKDPVLKAAKKDQRRFLFPARTWKIVSVCAVFVLGVLLGRLLIFTPSGSFSIGPAHETLPVPVLTGYFEDIRTALIEYNNLRVEQSNDQILAFEKERLKNLLFQNRMIKTRLQDTEFAFLLPLLYDLELVLFEAANLSQQDPEYLVFIQGLINEKEIFFRLRHIDLESNRTYLSEESF